MEGQDSVTYYCPYCGESDEYRYYHIASDGSVVCRNCGMNIEYPSDTITPQVRRIPFTKQDQERNRDDIIIAVLFAISFFYLPWYIFVPLLLLVLAIRHDWSEKSNSSRGWEIGIE